jgi:hypothetical protein
MFWIAPREDTVLSIASWCLACLADESDALLGVCLPGDSICIWLRVIDNLSASGCRDSIGKPGVVCCGDLSRRASRVCVLSLLE